MDAAPVAADQNSADAEAADGTGFEMEAGSIVRSVSGAAVLARLAWPATLLLALLLFSVALARPENNWDALAYSALAKQFRGEEGHAASYREMREHVGPERYRDYIDGPYRQKMASDAAYFQSNMPFYASKPLYVAAIATVGRALGSDAMAMSVIAGLSTALGVIASFFIAARLLPQSWLFAVPVAWIVGLGTKLATLSTPDSMAIVLQLLFVLVWLERRATGAWLAMAAVIAMAWVATRSNALLPLAALFAVEALRNGFERDGLIRAGAIMLAAVVVYKIVVHLSGNHGQLVLFNFVFIDKPDGMTFPNHGINIVGYVRAVLYGAFEAATSYPEFIVCLLALGWLATTDGGLSGSSSSTDPQAGTLAAAMLLAMLAHFALYPATWERFFVGYYVVTFFLVAQEISRRTARRIGTAP